jgi:LuxR family maltose regulon positive regulatory protein
MQAVALAEQHGWTDNPAVALACMNVAAALINQGRPDQAEPWIQRAERTVRAAAEPALAIAIGYVRGVVEFAQGRDSSALAAFRAAERLGGLYATTTRFVPPALAMMASALVRLGDTEGAEQALARLGDADRETGEICVAAAELRLAQDDPRAAIAALAPALAGSAPVSWLGWKVRAYLLEAIATDALGETRAAEQALEHALDLAEPNGALHPFLHNPAPRLLERHRHRTAHAALIAEILSLLAGNEPAPPPARPRPLQDPLSETELRVLRYLPTNLTAPEIPGELYVSVNTVKTHVRNLYAKLGTHRRAEAVARARDLGLLAPSTLRR